METVEEKKFEFSPSASLTFLPVIDIGTGDEVFQARAFARSVAGRMGFRPEWETLVVQFISVMALHLFYVHARKEDVFAVPSAEELRNLFLCSIVEEEKTDEDGEPEEFVSVKCFADMLENIMGFEHITHDGIKVMRSDETGIVSEGESLHITAETLHALYPADKDVYCVCPYVHPWIYRNIIAMYNDSDVDKGAAMAAAALERYIEYAGSEEGQKERYGRRLKNPFRKILNLDKQG